ncbi:LacI family DNA-binding transcriptional regulator [Microbacterium aerolatum]|uniref:LacI family DNA-binding transcriptional regulator n=1 Tax=Microbacterium aerolatum TaxID=153731 RepID=UPI00384DA00E
MSIQDRQGGARGGAVGLVLRRPVRTLGIEAFYNELMAGLEDVLTVQNRALVLQVVPDMESELDAYQRWQESGRVSAVLIVDVLTPHDPRLSLVRELGFPALVLAHPDDAGGHTALWTDESAVVGAAVEHLLRLGHARLGRVSGPEEFSHTARRTAAFSDAAVAAGVQATIATSDFSKEGGAAAVDELLRGAAPPSAIVFDNDVMAAGAVEFLRRKDVRIPEDLSIVAGDDSVLCRVTVPALTAMNRDVHALGEIAGDAIMRLIAGEEIGLITAPTSRLIARQSTSPFADPETDDA